MQPSGVVMIRSMLASIQSEGRRPMRRRAATYNGPNAKPEFHRVTRPTIVGIRLGIVALVALGASLIATSAIHAAQVATGPESGSQRAVTIDDREIAKLVRFRIEKQRRALSAVVGVIRPSGRSIIAYKSKRSSHAVEPGGDTIFEIASLTKIFTALLLADAVTRDEVRLDDPLSAFVPMGVKVPEFSGRAITLADLASHTSGLPRRPNNLNAAAPDAPNKYAGYTLNQLYAGLPEYRLAHAPGSQFEYSNVAFGLLGQALARRADEPFPELLRRRVIVPLGLSDTRFDEDPAVAARRAQGHDMDLKPIGPSSDGALNPSGGLRSTANDLLRLLDLFVSDADPGGLQQAARLMLTLDRPGDDDDTRMMLGWRRTVSHGETYYWSYGSSDGSRTFMGFNPARGVAVVALADASSGGGLDDIASRVLDPMEPVDLKVVPRPRTVELPPAAIDRVLGMYRYAPEDEMTITRGVTGLIVTAGSGQFLIQPQSRTRFFAKAGGDIYLDFPGSASKPADRMVLHQAGKRFVYQRVQPDVTGHD
jgi:serine-type D-Ala-D-Ala carboxypeptidase/endopeptidase